MPGSKKTIKLFWESMVWTNNEERITLKTNILCTCHCLLKNIRFLVNKIVLLPALKAVVLTKPGAVRPARIISPAFARFAS